MSKDDDYEKVMPSSNSYLAPPQEESKEITNMPNLPTNYCDSNSFTFQVYEPSIQ